jgi:hypothetical protein
MVYPNMKLPLTHFYTDFKNEFGGARKYFLDYISLETNNFIQDLAKKRYSSLINNREYVKKYEEYAKINLRTGLYKNNHYVPENYC